MKNLPYYKLWVKDFDTNENVRLLDLREAGLFLFCLNHAWINDGLPNSPDDIARALKITPAAFRKMWERVGKCFFVGEDGRLRNTRQEEERAHAISKSKQASDAVAERERKRNVRSSDDTSDDHLRALARADSECVSGFLSLEGGAGGNKKPAPRAADLDGITGHRFQEFWLRYPLQDDRDSAARMYLSVVTADEEPLVFACLDRYLASDQVGRSVVLASWKWLGQQKRNNWAGQWPKAREQPAIPAPHKSMYVEDKPPARKNA